MKNKKFSIVVIALSLVLLLAGCDGSISQTLTKFMDPFHDNNIYVNAGLIKPSTAGMDGVKEAMKTEKVDGNTLKNESGKAEISAETAGFGDVVTALQEITGQSDLKLVVEDETLNNIVVTNGVLAPQSAEQKQKLNESISKINSSPTESKAFSEEMAKLSEDSNAAKGTLAVAVSVIDTISNKLDANQKAALDEIKDVLKTKATQDEPLTQGEVLQAQMVTNLIASSASAISEINKGGNVDVNNEKVSSFIDESLAVINTSKALAGGSLINITDLIGVVSPMMGGFTGGSDQPSTASSKAISRDGESEYDYDKFIATGEFKIPSSLSEYGSVNTPEEIEQTQKDKDSAMNAYTAYKNTIRILFGVSDNGTFSESTAKARLDAYAMLFKYYQNMITVLNLNAGQNKAVSDYIVSKLGGTETTAVIDAIFGFVAGQLSSASDFFAGDANLYMTVVKDLVSNNTSYFTKDYKFVSGETIKLTKNVLDKIVAAGLLPPTDEGFSDEYSDDLLDKVTEYYFGTPDEALGSYTGTDRFNAGFATFDGMINAVGLDSFMNLINSMMGGQGDTSSWEFTSFKKMYSDMLKDRYESEKNNPEAQV